MGRPNNSGLYPCRTLVVLRAVPSSLTSPPPSTSMGAQSVLTLELCNVMVVSRTAWEVIERDHPIKACKVFASLQRGCEDKVGACA